jgi:heme/copper-type cytochrome/quinol oxidase subunit 2
MKSMHKQVGSIPSVLVADDAAARWPEDLEQASGRIVQSPKAHLVAAFVIASSVLLIIPMWWAYGVLLPEDGGHAHGAEELVSASEFEEKTARFIEEHGLPDGSVRAAHDKPIHVMAIQYAFKPNTVRLAAGEEYELQMLSTDVVHAFSVQMGNTSYNAVVMPGVVTTLKLKPTRPGRYLVFCNEYCGIGHDYMYFSLIVEEGGGEDHHEHASGEQREKRSTIKKGGGHAGH